MSQTFDFDKLPNELKFQTALNLSDEQIKIIMGTNTKLHNLFTTGEYANNFWRELIARRYSADLLKKIQLSPFDTYQDVYSNIRSNSYFIDDDPRKRVYDLSDYFNMYRRVRITKNTIWLLKYDGELLVISAEKYDPPIIDVSKYKNEYFTFNVLNNDEIPMTFVKYYNDIIRKQIRDENPQKRELPEIKSYGIRIKHIKSDNQIIDVYPLQHADLDYSYLLNFYAKTLNGSVLVMADHIINKWIKVYQESDNMIGIKILADVPGLIYFTFKFPIHEIAFSIVEYQYADISKDNPFYMTFTTRLFDKPTGRSEMYKTPKDRESKQLIKVCQIDDNDPSRIKLADHSPIIFYRGSTLFIVVDDKINYYNLGFKILYVNFDPVRRIRIVGENNVHVVAPINEDASQFDLKDLVKDGSAIIDNVYGKDHDNRIENGTLTEFGGVSLEKGEPFKLGISKVIKIDYDELDLVDRYRLFSLIIRRNGNF